ncbi:hypothetical protein M9H77_13047 [Catharanthus roseus]|uniref:Uncharacterized protein n=1 Tax=Catharanthus roseus TaxID=4058 RepID=A0ACC0BJA9_CATRO|nr:hypothetical protein M9H77_13047 [Catharanthus roseus]
MGCVELALFAEQYNGNLVKEFSANLTKDFCNSESPAYGQVYVRRHVIDFSPTNITHYLSCPHYNDIEGTGLEEKVNFDGVAKTNKLNLNLFKMPYRALFRGFCGNWLPPTNSIDPGVLPPSPTSSIQGHLGPGRSTRQQSIKKKQSGTNMASPSPPPPSEDSSKVIINLDLLNQQLSNITFWAWPYMCRLGRTVLPTDVSCVVGPFPNNHLRAIATQKDVHFKRAAANIIIPL